MQSILAVMQNNREATMWKIDELIPQTRDVNSLLAAVQESKVESINQPAIAAIENLGNPNQV